MDPASGGHHQRKDDLVTPRCIGDGDFHRIKMTADVGSIDVGDGDIKRAAHSSDFLGRRNNREGSSEGFAHGVTARDMPESTVFQFTVFADNGAFSVTLDLTGTSKQEINSWAASSPTGLRASIMGNTSST